MILSGCWNVPNIDNQGTQAKLEKDQRLEKWLQVCINHIAVLQMCIKPIILVRIWRYCELYLVYASVGTQSTVSAKFDFSKIKPDIISVYISVSISCHCYYR